MSIQNLDAFLGQTQFPEPALAPVKERAEEYVKLVQKSNGLVAQIEAAKTDNASNVEFLDKRWRANETDPAIAKDVEEFDVIAEQYEKLLAKLRNHAKANYIPEALSEDAARAARKTVNDMSSTIAEARKGLEAMLIMPETMLSNLGVEFPKDGLISLLPTAESLKGSGRGRKSSEGGVSYMTRVKEILVEGESTNRNGKGKMDYAADKLSERFNSKSVPQNKVTPEELEIAYWASLPGSPEPRSKKSTELPDEHTFVFEKTIQVQNGNDDSFKSEPHKVNITIRNGKYGETAAATETPKAETEKAEANASEGEKAATEKAETLKPGDFIKPEPAKKATAAKAEPKK